MKIKDGFVLREIDGNNIVVAVGKASLAFSGMISLNGTGAFLWKQLEKGASEEELREALLAAYDVDEITAADSINVFINKVREADLLD